MKKIIIVFCLFLLCGCNLNNTPTKKVEDLFTKYQTLDKDILSDLNEVVNREEYNQSQKDEYTNIMKKHYQNLTYKIKNETIDGDKALVETEITVTDYSKVINDANIYRDTYINEFSDELGNYNPTLFLDYKLKKIKETEDKVKYTLEIPLTLINNSWEIDSLPSTTLDKIHGIYSY